ncbi:TetM/TetW/TetO/TetS family tetracycline resistance ribosomal protection protein [Streptomyces litchfieldiae]|uniref:TetM/TetW/TetO/TetS family tetracycline resistance ribosomal protection protein n=1 Tax=Streptomyces litchfieldiae TaxID=3075543 RepID=A0ABU2MNY2_9ACTN|nr:TetM/TetW/TetO/TetS family tetracycline resistance ribosomal protection protein [Streptomyces sp. DSM 44938]MDT0343215.1 TetM/TetW/TetO/TetS family tetracycline resistance ribosomal protection protein [Streptomyces sp. DSM 44938]
MPDQTLNLGILAHIDAGKTSLTERLLFDNGAISELGSVDAGSTRTDAGELERERGITIRSAVAAFAVGDLQVNLVDTPGHPDFIAEVERALSVLDGAVLVLSAVEGVQAQTRVLMKSLARLRLPTVIFVNKIDRMGARYESLLADIRRRLAPRVVPLSTVVDAGTPHARAVGRSLAAAGVRGEVAEVLAECDDDLLARLVDGAPPSAAEVGELLAAQTAAGLVHPVFFGSALTGEGARQLTEGIRAWLRPPAADPGGEARGTVFAIERSDGGDKIAYLRLFSGQVRERQRVTFTRREPSGAAAAFTGRISRLDILTAPQRPPAERRLVAGSIARLRGLPAIRVGDRLGGAAEQRQHFSPPSLETVVRPRRSGEEIRLHAALTSLADEDPFIRTRPAGGGGTSVLLYGAVQREVIGERLWRDFGVEAEFEPITPVYVERPLAAGEALIAMDRRGGHDFWATVGLRVEPAATGAGIRFERDVEWGALPRAFHRAIEESALRALEQGLYGWEVADCTVTLIEVGYDAPSSVAADFRGVTPMVLLRALRAAGTRVYEPCQALEIEVPEDALSGVVGELTALGADVTRSVENGSVWLIGAELPARTVPRLTAALPGLTHGEGALWSRPGRDRPVRGAFPRRERFDGNPLNREEYLRFLSNRSLAGGVAAVNQTRWAGTWPR